jgi:PilZ domain
MKQIESLVMERRKKARFQMNRELRYKVVEDGLTVASGTGTTLDVGSGGVAFLIEQELPTGACVELSISWPVLLHNTCAIRLIVVGRVVRSTSCVSACKVDKYEFRTQARAVRPIVPLQTSVMLQRMAANVRKDNLKIINA